MAEWRYVKSIGSLSRIEEAEKELGIVFDSEFVSFLKQYNGGRPPISVFDTDKMKERTIKSFLSVNINDTENIYKANEVISTVRSDVIPFAIDNFGNYICFCKADNSIVFLDFETGETEHIADRFEDFLRIVTNGQ